MMKKLDIEQAEPIRKKYCPSWEIRKGAYLYKKVAFDDYNQALRFFMVIEKPQIKLDHFADFMNFYNELTIAITTHDVGGLTQLDFELALPIDKALKQMGAKIYVKNQRTISSEIGADLEIEHSNLVGCELDPEMAKFMIDEYPILSIAAAFAKGTSVFKGLKELKVKESDRLELIRLNLVNCGCDCRVINDDLIIKPSQTYIPKNNKIRTDFDHRIAMSFAVMGSKVGNLIIEDSESINTSFPNFIKKFNNAGGNIL